jgi:hypothetical protein
MSAFEQLFFTIPDNTFKDIDQNDKINLSFSVKNYTSIPAFISFNSQNNTFTFEPTNADAGKYTIIVRATDLSGEYVETTFSLAVTEALSITKATLKLKSSQILAMEYSIFQLHTHTTTTKLLM